MRVFGISIVLDLCMVSHKRVGWAMSGWPNIQRTSHMDLSLTRCNRPGNCGAIGALNIWPCFEHNGNVEHGSLRPRNQEYFPGK